MSSSRFALSHWISCAKTRLSWRPVLFAIGTTALIAAAAGRDVGFSGANASAELAEALTERGLACVADDVLWVSGSRGKLASLFTASRAVVRAATAGEPSDLYSVTARMSPEGRLLAVDATYNLTRTTGVDESRASARGPVIAYTTQADGLVTGVHTLDLAGRPMSTYSDFTRTQRAQVALSNLQQTGQSAGVIHNSFALDPPAGLVKLDWPLENELEIIADGREIMIDARSGTVHVGEAFVRATLDERAKPGNVITWAVDRVRAIPWFGEDRMQWLKAVAFTAQNWLDAHLAKETTADDVQKELGAFSNAHANAAFIDPETGWPPSPLKPVLTSPIQGEGEWISLEKDPFISESAGGSTPFATTFIRPNPRRPDLRVFITLWDPRVVSLHAQSGTIEPVSSTGERGSGLIPRTPERMRHVVAAFNGGFQAQHGEYGMQADGILYLPPKPYAATVMELRDGTTAFGTWPASAPIPNEVLSFRQNLTALVDFDKFNPWGRSWWGGTPPGWADNIHSARSAICLTKERFVGYFYSSTISPDDLAAALLAARCQYGIHLDMNPGHAGFEFYNVAPTSQFKPLGRPLQGDWEAEGKVGQLPDWVFRARRMIRGMGHMNFPRYIQREGRDFFYLTARATLPGAEVPSALDKKEAGEGEWRVKGLPQHGYPYALATSWVHADSKKPRAKFLTMRVDPHNLKAMTASAEADAQTIVSFAGVQRAQSGPSSTKANGASTADVTLWFGDGIFSIARQKPDEHTIPLIVGVPFRDKSPAAASARAAVGVDDDDGMLNWIELGADEVADSDTPAAMERALEKMGCSMKMLVVGRQRAVIGNNLDFGGAPLAEPVTTTARLARGKSPGAALLFEKTELVPYSVWQPLQAARVRVHAKPQPTAKPASSSGVTPASIASPN